MSLKTSRILNPGLKIGRWNIQGLKGKSNDKTADKLFLKEVRKYHIVILTETLTVEGEDIQIADYYTYNLHRPKHVKTWKGSGGIAVAIRNSIRKYIKILPPKSKDYIWLQLENHAFSLEKDSFICAAYIFLHRNLHTQSN